MRSQGKFGAVGISIFEYSEQKEIGVAFRHRSTGNEDAYTWAVAQNAANKLDAMGIDGDKAIKLLPELLERIGPSADNRPVAAIVDFLAETKRQQNDDNT